MKFQAPREAKWVTARRHHGRRLGSWIEEDRAMPLFRKLLALSVVLGSLGLTACDDADGPAEQAGEKVDEVIQDTTRAVDDATD